MKRFSALACLGGLIAFLATSTLDAQSIDPQSAASAVAAQLQGQVTGIVTSSNAPTQVPGYGGSQLPQGNYLASPDQLASDGATQALTSEPYQIVTNPNQGSFVASTINLSNAQAIEANPNSFTGTGFGAGGSQGNCQQLPPTPGSASTYYDSCQIGQSESDTSFTCSIAWANQLANSYQYTCHSSEWDFSNSGSGATSYWGLVSDCGSFASQSTCSLVSQSTRPPTTTVIGGLAENFTETDYTYNCSAQTNFGTAASSTYCVAHGTWCFVPPAMDNAPGVPGATYNGQVQTYLGSSIDNSDCQAKLGAAAACPSGYVQQGSQCVSTTAALVTYSCPAGWTLEGNQCSLVQVQAASLTGYTCPSGYSLSGTSCTEAQAATISGYSCPSGYTLSGTSCTSNQFQAATPLYSCPTGYGLSGSSCTQAINQPATPSYSCPSGFTLTGTSCSETVSEAATPGYSCPGGYTLSGTTCSETSSYAATAIYTCPTGGTLSGTSCVHSSSYAATAAYSCPSGWTLNGTTCSQTTTTATSTYSCPSGSTISQFKYICHSSEWDIFNPLNSATAYWGSASDCGAFASQTSCSLTSQNKKASTSAWPPGAGLEEVYTETDYTYTCSGSTNYGTAASNSYCLGSSGSYCFVPPAQDAAPGVSGSAYVGATCTATASQPATVSFSCPTGGTLSGSTCTTTTSQAASASYSCPTGGTLAGQTCTISSSLAATISYSCPIGYTLTGTSCSQTVSQAAGVTYSCPAGSSLSGSNCLGTNSQTASVGYSCPIGWTLAGTSCTLTSSIAATSIYSCPVGLSLSGSECIGQQAATPTYSCPTGTILDGSNCTQSQNQAATASYTCPSGTTLSGSNCIATIAASGSGGAGGMSCMPPTEVCVDSSPTTRTIDGVQVTHDCWQWQASYQCGTLTSANSCAQLQSQSNCTFDHQLCLDDPQVGPCQVESEVYKCTTPNPTQNPGAYSCSGNVYCINGSCTQMPSSPSPDLANALVAINAMGDATNQLNPNSLTIFDGTATGCHKPLFGLVNCCAGKVSGMLTAASSAIAIAGILSGNYTFLLSMVTQFLVLFMCSQQEMLLDVQDRMGQCTYVGEYCSQKALFVCTTERMTYCCFQSKLARVIQEQGKAQLGLNFGSPQSPNCTGFTVAQFSQLDLSKMDFSEVFSDFTSAVSLPSSLQTSTQIQQQVQQYYQNAGATGSGTTTATGSGQ